MYKYVCTLGHIYVNINKFQFWSVKALATAEEYNLESLKYGLVKQNLYLPTEVRSSTKGKHRMYNSCSYCVFPIARHPSILSFSMIFLSLMFLIAKSPWAIFGSFNKAYCGTYLLICDDFISYKWVWECKTNILINLLGKYQWKKK